MKRGRLFVAACAGIFVFGIVLALLGTLFGLPEMQARLHVNLGQQGDLFLLLFFAIWVATVVVGPTIDRFGNKIVLFLSSLLVAAALVGFSVAQSFAAAAISAILLGLGGGGLNTSTNVVVSDLYGDDRGSMLNILGMFFGFGALFIPLLAASITKFFNIEQLTLVAAGLAALTMLAYALLPFPPPREAWAFSLREAVRTAQHPGVLLLASMLFFQSGNEASIGGWSSTYVGSMGWEARTATLVLAGYWAALMAGRMLAARLLRYIEKGWLVFLSGLGSVAGCAVLLSSRSLPWLAAGASLTGLSFAAIYPTSLAMAADRYPRFAGTLFGLLFTFGLAGGMVFPWGIGHLSERFGVRSGMLLPLVGTTMVSVLMGVILARPQGANSRR